MVIICLERYDLMKKLLKVVVFSLVFCLMVGCGCMKKTAKGAVEDYLSQYKNLSANVIGDMDSVINNENLTDKDKEKYREVLKKQYQDLKYEVINEEYNGDTAKVDVKIKVYDLYKVQKEADEYLNNNTNEFMENGVYNSDLFMSYKLDKMRDVKDMVEYNITFDVSKDEDGNYKVINVSNDTTLKIHGIYNYEND